MKRLILLCALFLACLSKTCAEPSVTRKHALDLLDEGDTTSAAIEFRRLSYETGKPTEQAGWNWMAAYCHAIGTEKDRLDLTTRSLDRAEETASGDDLSLALSWLRAETAADSRHWQEAAFYYRSLEHKATTNDTIRDYAIRQQAVSHLQQGEREQARETLEGLSGPDERKTTLEALDAYTAANHKSPRIGGLLGIIPGFGYLYSGEYGNAARSLFLNGIFIWGMIETAQEDYWGLFSVITFGELTWYTGSIYGGIDSAHRYNRHQLEKALDVIKPAEDPRPDTAVLPLIRLRFEF